MLVSQFRYGTRGTWAGVVVGEGQWAVQIRLSSYRKLDELFVGKLLIPSNHLGLRRATQSHVINDF